MTGKLISRLTTFLVLALTILSAACTPTPTATQSSPGITPVAPAVSAVPAVTEAPSSVPTAVPTVIHLVRPDEPPAGSESQILDTDTSTVASQHHASGGENYNNDLFERPFDQSMNTYFPDLDLKNAAFSRDPVWAYVTLTLQGPNPKGGLLETYGVELDTNRDGRGDFLVLAAAPGASWSTDGVRVWKDGNHDVGGMYPVQADKPPQTGDSYETLLVDSGRGTDSDLAWARVSPSNPNLVQIAFKRALYADASKFLWGAWAIAPEMVHPDWFDYNDHFTQADAGSPLVELSQYYPLKALYGVDNTCRWGVGFTPTGSEPGICPVPSTPTPPPAPTHTPTPTRQLARLTGFVFYDTNNNSGYDNPPDHPIGGASIRVRAGSCGSAGSVVTTGSTSPSGNFSLVVPPGTYCVDVHPNPSGITWTQKSPAVTMSVSAGSVSGTEFWYRQPVLH